MKTSKKIAMLFQSRYAIALVAVSSCVFGVIPKSFANDFAPASTTITPNSVNVIGRSTNTTPAAAAAVFSSDLEGNITEGAVSAAVGTTSAAATASHGNNKGIITNTAAALGSTDQIEVDQDLKRGVVNLINITP